MATSSLLETCSINIKLNWRIVYFEQHNIWQRGNSLPGTQEQDGNRVRTMSNNDQQHAAATGAAPGHSYVPLTPPAPLNLGVTYLFTEYNLWKDSYNFFEFARMQWEEPRCCIVLEPLRRGFLQISQVTRYTDSNCSCSGCIFHST